jgi:hypothetical protein
VRPVRFSLVFLLFRKNGLHHVAWLGYVGKIDLRSDSLRAARLRSAMATLARSMVKASTYLFGFILFKRAGVGLACTQAEFRQHVKNLAALYFQLAREIVNSNLAHPPLFNFATQSP